MRPTRTEMLFRAIRQALDGDQVLIVVPDDAAAKATRDECVALCDRLGISLSPHGPTKLAFGSGMVDFGMPRQAPGLVVTKSAPAPWGDRPDDLGL
jgi:hypothetical protein